MDTIARRKAQKDHCLLPKTLNQRRKLGLWGLLFFGRTILDMRAPIIVGFMFCIGVSLGQFWVKGILIIVPRFSQELRIGGLYICNLVTLELPPRMKE